MSARGGLLLTLLVPGAVAQIPNAGGGVVPASLANAFGNSNNGIPFSWSPTQYQQVFLGSELPTGYVMRGLGLRQDDQYGNLPGKTVDLEIHLGFTSLTPATLTTTFASNFDSGAPVNVLARTNVNLPALPAALPTDPAFFLVEIPFSTPFPWPASGGGQNLLIQVTQRGNNNNNQAFSYPLDAASGTTTTRLYGFPDTATTGTLQSGFGLVMCLAGLGTQARFDTYGAGCAGTGGFVGTTLPALYANQFGNSNTNIPFAWTPTRYQQVFLGAEVGPPHVTIGLGLRQPTSAPGGYTGNTIDLELNMGYTTRTPATLTNTFASNFDLAPPVNVLSRTMVNLPNIPTTTPTDPRELLTYIPFTTPFLWGATGDNLLFEAFVHGNSIGNQRFTWQFDAAGGGANTSRVYGGSPAAVTGTLNLNFGVVMMFQVAGPGSTTPVISASGRPRLGSSFQVGLAKAKAATLALLLVGSSSTSWSGIPLPLDLTPVGAPGCALRASANITILTTATDVLGNGSVTVPVPNDPSLIGAHAFQQYAVVDTFANALGLAFTAGGDARLGDV